MTNNQKKDTTPIPINNTEIIVLNQVVSEKPGGALANSSGKMNGISIPTIMKMSAINAAINSVLYFNRLWKGIFLNFHLNIQGNIEVRNLKLLERFSYIPISC